MLHKKGPRSALRRALILISTLAVTACGEDDRVVAIACSSGNPIAADFERSTPEGIRVGYVNVSQLSLGTIYQLTSQAVGMAPNTRVRYTLQISAADLLPQRAEISTAKVVGGNFAIKADKELRDVTNSLGINLRNEVEKNTLVYLYDAKRATLRDPIGLINADERAVRLVMSGGAANESLFLVSAVSYASGIEVFSDSSALSKVPGFIVHVESECPEIDAMNTRGRTLASPVAVLSFNLPLKYDVIRGKVELDTQRLPANRSLWGMTTK
jgi:hypothetical protein